MYIADYSSVIYFSAVCALMLLIGQQKVEWWSIGVVICLGRDADLHMA